MENNYLALMNDRQDVAIHHLRLELRLRDQEIRRLNEIVNHLQMELVSLGRPPQMTGVGKRVRLGKKIFF